MWNDVFSNKIVLCRDGFSDITIRKRNDYYEMLSHKDYYGHEYWEKLPISNDIIERDILKYYKDCNDILIIKDIRTKEMYEVALERLNLLMDATPENGEGDALSHLADIICDYEKIHYPIK